MLAIFPLFYSKTFSSSIQQKMKMEKLFLFLSLKIEKGEKHFTRLVTDDNKKGQNASNGFAFLSIQTINKEKFFVCVRVSRYIPISNGLKWMEKSSDFKPEIFLFENISTINYSECEAQKWIQERREIFHCEFFRIHFSIAFINVSFPPLNSSIKSDDFRFPSDDIELQHQFVISSRNVPRRGKFSSHRLF